MSTQAQTINVGMCDASPNHHPLFNGSVEAIERTILEGHRRIFQHIDASSLLDELQNIATRNSTCDRTFTASSRKFALFVRAFAHYFSVLEICTQVRVEWPGCFWGLVRLIFQVASDYPLFLEKIADKIEVMASVLPPYHQIYAICKRRIDSSQTRTDDKHLTTLMSYVYDDIIKICLDIYCIFFRDLEGPVSRHLTFDSVHVPQWRPLDSRFAQLEGRLAQHRKWLEKETEVQIQDFAEVERYRKRYVRFLHRRHDLSISSNGGLEEQRLAKRIRRVNIVRDWLSNGSQSLQTESSVSRTEHLGSSNWFLDLVKYRSWKHKKFDRDQANDANALQDDWHDRVIFVQAEMGFGKTVLARAVVDDLTAEAEDLESSNKPPCTAYFHASANHLDPVNPDDVFRQLALQILQTHRYDHTTLDTVCLLLRKTSFQEAATANEVLDVLLIMMRQHPTFLVIDGLDDCSEMKAFLSSLANLCRKSDSRVIIFSKPGIKIPLEYQKWASDAPHIISLDSQYNSNIIENFMVQNLDQMAGQGYFGISTDRALILRVAQRPGGAFLWATLLSKYLHCPVLSPDERQDVLHNVQSLRGLETLYSSIFRAIGRRPTHEKRIIADVFRWLSFPVHRLCVSALRTALASSNDMRINEGAFTTDILQALPQLTSGLVEVSDNNVFFTHPSAREYLQSPQSQGLEFSLYDEGSVHGHLAARCLSYLAHDVPKRPLGGLTPHIRPTIPANPASSSASYRTSNSGDSGYKSLSSSDSDNAIPHPAMQPQQNNASTTSIQAIPFDTSLPFLRYASLCWPVHLSRALGSAHDQHVQLLSFPEPFGAVPYLPAMSAFLSSRLAVSAWVEASFRYSLPPTLTRLVGPLSDLRGEIPSVTIEGRELRLVVDEVNILSERLMELKRSFATSLRENPSLIWQMGDTTGEDYWPVWDRSTDMAR
ncbi:hypothetical protein GQ44DRAFT_700960 [Phaeosphaeriaceae sp. PMI808]|nr:hypothetical protein GQ44DRAFT_700960 [Phaeosphaeriaceae sp. PMI808]